MDAMIKIEGGKIDREGVEAIAPLVLQIIASPAADAVKLKALEVIHTAAGVQGLHFSDVHLDAQTHNHYAASAEREAAQRALDDYQDNIDGDD